jgi:ankyrin repeat protein
MGENAKDKNKKTALHLAASLGKKKAVEELLKKGANADAEDKDNRTLHLAVMGDGKEVGGIVEPLLAKMKNNIAKDSRGQTALHVAAAPGKEGALEKLLANRDVKAAIDGPDNKKWTPPQYGANQKRKRASEIPKSQGADTAAKHN